MYVYICISVFTYTYRVVVIIFPVYLYGLYVVCIYTYVCICKFMIFFQYYDKVLCFKGVIECYGELSRILFVVCFLVCLHGFNQEDNSSHSHSNSNK